MSKQKIKELEEKVRGLQARVDELEGKPSTTYIGVVQDKSSSMTGREEATVSGFNEYTSDLQKRAKKDGITYRLTLTQFNTEFETLYENEPLDKVKTMTEDDYIPSGCTALFDAIGRTVEVIDKQMSGNDRALILVMTDGEENSSRKITSRQQVREIIEGKEKTGRWTFVYLGADQDAFAAGTRLGFAGGNTVAYANTASGIRSTYSSLASASHSHSVSGGGATTNFTAQFIDPVEDEDEGDGVGVE